VCWCVGEWVRGCAGVWMCGCVGVLIVFLKAELLKSDLGCRKETSPLLVVHDKDTHTDRGSVRERATDTHIQSDADPDTDRH